MSTNKANQKGLPVADLLVKAVVAAAAPAVERAAVFAVEAGKQQLRHTLLELRIPSYFPRNC